jgi:DtxR family transcriptional regulator, Mn-dependent transcriptional regulator
MTIKNNNLSASLEDYLEAILNVADSSGVARSKDIAASLGVAKPSVTGALKLLSKKRLVNYRPYGSVSLTESGLAQAEKVAKKHDILESFFMDFLGVDHSIAHTAACRSEHLLGPTIVARMGDFADFAKKQGAAGDDLMNVLKKRARKRAGK